MILLFLFSWHDVDRAAEGIGTRLAELGYSERIGIKLQPFGCLDNALAPLSGE